MLSKFCNKIGNLEELYVLFPVLVVFGFINNSNVGSYIQNLLQRNRVPDYILAQVYPGVLG